MPILFKNQATTEDVIDVGDLDYEWQLSEASKKLENFVQTFELYKIGLSDTVQNNVCPEATDQLFNCLQSQSIQEKDRFYQECIAYIDEIFKKGFQDLKTVLGKYNFYLNLNNLMALQIIIF